MNEEQKKLKFIFFDKKMVTRIPTPFRYYEVALH
jgi:hypothetical protein